MGDFVIGGSSTDKVAARALGVRDPRSVVRAIDLNDVKDAISGWRNVRSYGASPGKTAAQNAVAFQAAIDDVTAAANGGYVFVPGGDWSLDPIFIRSPLVHLIGAGRRQTVIHGSTGADTITIECPTSGIYDIALEDFQIIGGARGIVIRSKAGQAGYLCQSQFRRILITQTTAEAFYAMADLVVVLESTWEQVYTYGGTYGGRFEPGSGVDDGFNLCTFIDCQWRVSSTYGLALKRPHGVRLYNNLFESNQQTGLLIDAAAFAGVVLDGGWFEANATNQSGGPYPIVEIKRSVATAERDPQMMPYPYTGLGGQVVFRNVHMAPQWDYQLGKPRNDGVYSVKVTSDNVTGPLVFDNCNVLEYANDGAVGRVDVGAYTIKATVELRGHKTPPVVVGTTAYRLTAQAALSMNDQGAVVFAGTGLNDFQAHRPTATTSGQVGHVYDVQIMSTGSPDKFRYRVDGGSWIDNGGSGFPCVTGSTTVLADGVMYGFGATTGHTVNDTWTVTVIITQPFGILSVGGVVLGYVDNVGVWHLRGPTGSETTFVPDGSGNLKMPAGNFILPTDSQKMQVGAHANAYLQGSGAWLTTPASFYSSAQVQAPTFGPFAGNTAAKVAGTANDGSSAIGVLLANANTLSSAGAKAAVVSATSAAAGEVASFRTNGTKFGLRLQSPDGTWYLITVANGGTLTVTANP